MIFKNFSKINTIYFLSVIFLFLGFMFITYEVSAAPSPTFQMQIVSSVCGNGIRETGESCDGTELNGFTCQNLGYSDGSLSCSSSCTFNTSACTSGHGDSTNYTETVTPITTVFFDGKAYPDSIVTLLKDGQVVSTTKASSNGDFQINISDMAGGNYSFIIYSKDDLGNQSAFITLSANVTSGTDNRVSGILIPPTVMVDKSEVKQGDNIVISGQSYPNITIRITVDSKPEFIKEIKSSPNGKFSYVLDSSILSTSTESIKVEAISDDGLAHLGKVVSLIVGEKNVIKEENMIVARGDTNNDGKVNIVDFSIAAFWYNRILSPVMMEYDKNMLNGDGKIDLTDFSIIAYNWTG